MFKTILFWAQRNLWDKKYGGHCPRMSPVASLPLKLFVQVGKEFSSDRKKSCRLELLYI